MIYFKDEVHEQQTEMLWSKLKIRDLSKDIECGTMAYVMAATYKGKQLLQAIDDEGYIDIEKVYDLIEKYSSAEIDMIRFALQCYNGSIDDITLRDTMWSLDEENTKVIKQAIDLRY